MNMTRSVKVFVFDGIQLVEVEPLPIEKAMGRRMSATLQLLIREYAKTGHAAFSDTSIGKITYSQTMRGRKHFSVLSVTGGEFAYEEFRHWLVIALQYITGVYPLVSFTFDHSTVEIFIPGNKRLSDYL